MLNHHVKRCIVLFLLLISIEGLSQQTAIPKSIRAFNTLERMNYGNTMGTPGNTLIGIPMAPAEVVGDYYLRNEWRSGVILLYHDEKIIEGYKIKYDLLKNEIDLMVKNQVKALDSKYVKSFVWYDSLKGTPEYFVNSNEFKTNQGVTQIGFFEVLFDGTISLFKKTQASILRADYNPALNVGKRDHSIVKKSEYYLFMDSILVESPSSNKKFIKYLGSHKEETQRFINLNKLSVKNERDLVFILEHWGKLNAIKKM